MNAIKKKEEGGNPPLVSAALDVNIRNIGTIMTGRRKMKYLKDSTRTLKRIITF